MNKNEFYISVDIETSGPIPSEFSLLSIGACIVSNPSISIYLELKPISSKHDLEAIAVTGLNLDKLEIEGLDPVMAMENFEKWIKSSCPTDQDPIFVGLNAPFDWSFINYYFHKFLGRNPFGFTALDMKAYFMGANNCQWQQTKSSYMTRILSPNMKPSHNALDDAYYQAELFSLMMKKRENSQ